MHEPAPPFADVLQRALSRRRVLRGGLAGALGFVSGGLAGCVTTAEEPDPRQPILGFGAIGKSREDRLHFPREEGYRSQVLIPWGTPICGRYPAYRDGGLNSAEEQAQQAGMHHDGLHFFALPTGADGFERGLLVVNHEYVDRRQLLAQEDSGERRSREAVDKEMAAHGMSVVEIARDSDGAWLLMQGSRFNRRITADTQMRIAGPLRGTRFMQTRYSPDGTRCRGTLANCGSGHTPWGTYLSCEENFHNYFRSDDVARSEHRNYGIHNGFEQVHPYRWYTVPGELYERFDASPRGGDPRLDFGNEALTFGWVVEIDPRAPDAPPRKRTALGRFAHESCATSRAIAGRPLAFYMGDDRENEFIYKFVTAQPYDPATATGALLDEGTLYVARLDDDHRGEWLPLRPDNPRLWQATYGSLAEILIDTRGAARALGATAMDRPEWTTVHPHNGDVFVSLTGNARRGAPGEPPLNAANPRPNNRYGHILRIREQDGDAAARRFAWDVYLFGAPAGDHAANRSGLGADNEFVSPDGLHVDSRGVLWIQTDGDHEVLADELGCSNQMLAAAPLADGRIDLRRFLVGPPGSEVTGLSFTPDGRTLFVNIQHPGSGSQESHWPDGGDARPRSATVAIWHEDGRVIGAPDPPGRRRYLPALPQLPGLPSLPPAAGRERRGGGRP